MSRILLFPSPGRTVLEPTRKAKTSVKVVTETATPAWHMVCPTRFRSTKGMLLDSRVSYA